MNIEVQDLSKLHIRITTLGYYPQGESIMISIMDEEKALFNIITDCYEKDGHNYWKDKLAPNTHINVIIWTHPDEDHTKGLRELYESFKQNGKMSVLVPGGLSSSLLGQWNKKESADVFNFFENTLNTGKEHSLIPISTTQLATTPCHIERFLIQDLMLNKINIKISYFLPDSSICQRRYREINEGLNPGEMNDFSIAFIIEINNEFRMLFGGDMTQISLNQVHLDEEYYSNYVYVKIPHHGSNEPKLWGKFFPRNGVPLLAVTTTFNATNPSKSTLDNYAKINNCIVLATDKEKHEERGRNGNYGIVKTDFYLVNPMKVDIEIEGNATQVRGDKIFEDQNIKSKTINL